MRTPEQPRWLSLTQAAGSFVLYRASTFAMALAMALVLVAIAAVFCAAVAPAALASPLRAANLANWLLGWMDEYFQEGL